MQIRIILLQKGNFKRSEMLMRFIVASDFLITSQEFIFLARVCLCLLLYCTVEGEFQTLQDTEKRAQYDMVIY